MRYHRDTSAGDVRVRAVHVMGSPHEGDIDVYAVLDAEQPPIVTPLCDLADGITCGNCHRAYSIALPDCPRCNNTVAQEYAGVDTDWIKEA